jgi:hypothetical protein
MSYEDNVHYAYGFIDNVKLQQGNWSVLVSCYPQPDACVKLNVTLMYGGGDGVWIKLGDPPSTVAMEHGSDLLGKFVELRYMGDKPWQGTAHIINQPGTEDSGILMAEERGIMRALSAADVLI